MCSRTILLRRACRLLHTMATAGGGCPPSTRMNSEAAATNNTALLDTADTHPAAATAAMGAQTPECGVLASLKPRRSAWWYRAVAQSVTVLGAIVNNYIDVTGMRIAPTYDAVVAALRHYKRDGKVPEFKVSWEELRATPDGRAVVAVCEAAAEGDALLGRLSLTKMAEDPELEAMLQAYYKDDACVPVLLAAARYYRCHTGTAPLAATTEVAPPNEWPPLDSLHSYRYALSFDGTPTHKWLLAVAPAMTVLERTVGRLLDVTATPLTPTHDSLVVILQMSELDELVPRFEAAWQKLRSTPNGRAVIAVCKAARDGDAVLGWYNMAEVAASVPDLEAALKVEFEGEDYLPVLLAAARYYLDPTTDAALAAAAAAADGAGSCE